MSAGAAPRGDAAVNQTGTVPTEYCQLPTAAPPLNSGQAGFSEYAWQLFVALNWPVTAGQRGVPDCSRPFAAPGSTVWESFKTTQQLFLPGAKDPGPWDSGNNQVKYLIFDSKADSSLPLSDSIRQAVGGWLIDQHLNPTYYEIAVNETSYNYVLNNRYYNADVLNGASTVNFPYGSLEIKASWRIMQAGDDQSRYHTIKANVMVFDNQGNPTGQYKPAVVGLVGLHIVYKPAGFSQWTWATFEQVDNVTGGSAGVKPSYFNPDCSGAYCTPNVSPLKSGQPFTSANQITRITPIRQETVNVNTKWQSLTAGTPFQYYELISPQWPADPDNPGNPQGTPTPGTVANVTMESYIQPISSCMDCHSTARVPNNNIKTNYSFIFLFAQEPSEGSDKP